MFFSKYRVLELKDGFVPQVRKTGDWETIQFIHNKYYDWCSKESTRDGLVDTMLKALKIIVGYDEQNVVGEYKVVFKARNIEKVKALIAKLEDENGAETTFGTKN